VKLVLPKLVLIPLLGVLSGCALHATKTPTADAWCLAPQLQSQEDKHGVVGALADLNTEFLEAHARARTVECHQLEEERLVIRYSFGVIEARYRGKPLQAAPVNVLPSAYHPLKDVSHAVFLAALLLREEPGTARDAHIRSAVARIDGVRKELMDPGSSAWKLTTASNRDRQVRILDRTREVLLATTRTSAEQEKAYFDAVRPDLMENLREVSRATIHGLHQQVQRYREQVQNEDPSAWSSLVVVVGAVHQARASEIGVQYFERLLGESLGEGASTERRLVVAEGVMGGPEQYGLLSAHFVDQAGSALVFGDPLRMQRDVLADDGGALEEVLPKPRR
jgi:hypothetical protein